MVDATSAEVVASGGAGTMNHFVEAARAGAAVGLAASVFHFGTIAIQELKAHLQRAGVGVL
jgi:cyclase